MKRIALSIALLITTNILADENTTLPYNSENVTSTEIKENYPDASNEENTTNWNISDWNNYYKEKGANADSVGNTQALFGGSIGSTAFSANPNRVTSDALKKNKEINTTISMTSWDKDLEKEITNNSLMNTFISSSDARNISCYITRDISFQYQCSKTGLLYGGDVSKSGLEARRLCESNCFEQKQCVDVANEVLEDNIKIDSFSCEADKECSKEYAIFKDRKLETINFDFNTSYSGKFTITIKTIDNKNNEKYILNKLSSSFLNDKTTLFINEPIKEIYININNTENNDTANVANLMFNYPSSGKYICPHLQDITNLNPGNFANKCSSDNIVTLSNGHRTYEICSKGETQGDNQDGTFSSLNSCQSVCVESYDCSISMKTFSTELLHTFREGCIEGQPKCDDEDCKFARLGSDPILEETVFDATNQASLTVKSGVEAQDIKRPKVVIDDDIDFEKRALQEWKDEAYEYMTNYHKYAVSKKTLGEDSDSSSAYNISMIGSSYGVTGTATRTLYWDLKPRAFEIYNGTKYYFYCVIVANIGYHDYNLKAEKELKAKKIWYLKTGLDDKFKAIRIKEDAGYVATIDSKTKFMSNEYAVYKNKTFLNSYWINLNNNEFAEYFTSQKFEDTSLFWRFSVIENTGNILNNLPGIIRRKDAGVFDTKYYDGNFDGSGDALSEYKVYTLYSPNMLTYQDIYSFIDNNEINPLYSMNNANMYPSRVEPDSISEQSVEIFQYGDLDKTTIKMRIRPNENEVGKKGFIYVFIQ